MARRGAVVEAGLEATQSFSLEGEKEKGDERRDDAQEAESAAMMLAEFDLEGVRYSRGARARARSRS
jgi:hypothetical protein